MATNRGKSFEKIIEQGFLKVPGVSIDRLPDQTNGFKGGTNICDFIVYQKPYEYYIECKSVHGNTLSIHSNPKPDKNGKLHGFYGNITDTQWEGLLEKSKINGVVAGIICWWVDHDKTFFLPIRNLQVRYEFGDKSINIKDVIETPVINWLEVPGKKKRVYFDYDMKEFLNKLNDFIWYVNEAKRRSGIYEV